MPADSARIAGLERRGWTVAEIAEMLGVSNDVVRYHLINQGVIDPHRPDVPGAVMCRVVDLYTSDESIRACSAATGLAYGTIRAVLLYRDVTIRPSGPPKGTKAPPR